MLANHPKLELPSHRHVLGWTRCTLLLILCGGCSICPSPYDYDYGTYGTKTPRTDMRHGRVGSLFSDPRYTGDQQAASISYEDYGMDGQILYQEGVESQGMIYDEVITEGQISRPGEIIIQ